MRKTALVLSVVLVVAAFAAAPGHYDMGPAHRFAPEPAARTIGLSSGLVIDTRQGEPVLPADLRLEPGDPLAEYWIVQFDGPLTPARRRELERLGAQSFGYLPNDATICRMDAATRSQVAALPGVAWTGIFQPAYKLEPGLPLAGGPVRLIALLMPDAGAEAITASLAALGGEVNSVQTTGFGTTVDLTVDAGLVAALARVPGILWLQQWSEPTVANNRIQWVLQTGWRSSAPADTAMAPRAAWTHGVRGQRTILGVSDTGCNIGHNMMRDPDLPVTAPGVWPGHRKVVAFKLMPTASANESPYHGSHVSGTVVGDDSVNSGTSYYDANARDARLYFVDLTSSGGGFVISSDLTPLWDTTYSGSGLPDSLRPIKQHSGSWRWGNSSGTYLIQDASTDAFGWAHKDFMNIMAAGNEYSTRTIGNPSLAKNVLTIGAVQNGTSSNAIADFSSRGPAQDGRLKPNVMAPGQDVWSCYLSGNSYESMDGTSMATPAANSAVGLIRCYLAEGYYPTGAPVPANRIGYISSALLRSMAQVSADPNIGSYTPPDNNIGWGRINLDSVLYFEGDLRKLIITDDTAGLAQGEYKEYQFRVGSSIPLRVGLAWTDTAAAPNANPTLVNDLNLLLTSPAGTQYRGNHYTSGQSTPNPATHDSINVEEFCRVNSPDTGLWTIRVAARRVITGADQPFAWTITGDVAPVGLDLDAAPVAIIAPAGQIDTGATVIPRAVVANRGATEQTFDVEFGIGAWRDTQSVTLAAGAADTVDFTPWDAVTVGWFQSSCRTLLAGDENPANDVISDSFQVVPLTGVQGGGDLPLAYALDRAQPSPFAARTQLRLALPRGAAAQVAVYSADGRLVRTLVRGSLAAGRHTVTWDGTDDTGRRLGPGIYYCRFTAPGFESTRKLALAR